MVTNIPGGSLTTALNSTLSGSQVQSAKMSVLGRNINNIGVEGARAQKIVASTISVGGQSIGVEVAKVVRQVNMAYLLNAQKIKTNLEGAEVSKDFLDRVTQIFGSPKSKSAPGNLIAQFESAVEALSRNPSDGSLQFKLIQSTANKFTTTMNQNETYIQEFREEIEEMISVKVREFNDALEKLKEVNIQINSLSAYSSDYATLLDDRDRYLSQIKKISGANYFIQDTGVANVLAGDGSVDFVYKDTNPIYFVQAGKGSISRDMTYANGALSGLSVKDANGSDFDITGSFKAGSLHDLLKLRDQILPNLSEQMQQLSAQFKETVNKAYAPGTSIPPLGEMKSEKAIDATRFTLQTANQPGTVRLVKDPITNTYGKIEFAVLDKTGRSVGTACSIDLDQLKADIDTYHGGGDYQLTLQDVMNAVNGYYNHPPANVPPGTAQPDGWTGAWPLNAPLANNDSYQGLVTTSGQNGPLINNEFMQFDATGKLVFGAPENTDYGIAINESEVKFHFDGFADTDPGFSYPLGINNLFVSADDTKSALTIKVRDDIATDPSKFSRGVLKSKIKTPGTAIPLVPPVYEWYVGSADNSNLNRVSEALSKTLDFNAPGVVLPKATLESFATEMLSAIASLAEQANIDEKYYKELEVQIDTIISQESDPNLDTELANSIPVKEQYAALMHVITIIQRMLEDLLSAFR